MTASRVTPPRRELCRFRSGERGLLARSCRQLAGNIQRRSQIGRTLDSLGKLPRQTG